MLIALLLAAAAIPHCPWERAHHEMVGDPRFAIDVVQAPRGPLGGPELVLRFNFGKLYKARWYFTDGGSASVEHLISTNDPATPGWQPPDPDSRRGRPYSDMIVMGYGLRLNAGSARAASGFPAPAYLFVPEISDAMREGSDRLPNTVYRLSACAPR